MSRAPLGIEPEAIRRVFDDLGLRYEITQLGYVLTVNKPFEGLTRLERGGGIAGNGHYWCLRTRTGCTSYWHNVKELRRGLMEWIVGEPPPLVPQGWIAYVRRETNRFGDAFVWCTRPRRSGKER